ncbi:MAG: DUF362 domain-containing protein [Desulfovibrio sp.]|nr:DUF362 domain-containing protein [Desulfovibrio sp.]
MRDKKCALDALSSRRDFLKAGAAVTGALAVSGVFPGAIPALAGSGEKAKVYFTKEANAEGLLKLYERIHQRLTGKIAVKLHTGEPDGPSILPRDMVKALMAKIPDSAIVECNVLYSGPRKTTEGHRKVIIRNGWTFCPVDILDEDGDVGLPIPGGKQLTEVAVEHILNYDSMLVLTHFKGHVMGGFGGSLKNISIGCASGKAGKEQIHRQGAELWSGGPRFMERMVEGGRAITHRFGTRIAYINVLRNMSVDCDCVGTQAAKPVAPDIGMLASSDILAVDQASVDMVYALPESQKRDLVERIESRSGLRQLEYMKTMSMGCNRYELISL